MAIEDDELMEMLLRKKKMHPSADFGGFSMHPPMMAGYDGYMENSPGMNPGMSPGRGMYQGIGIGQTPFD